MDRPFTPSRRCFLTGTAAAAAMLSAPAILRAQTRELRLLTWEGYAEPEWLDAFKAATGAEVSVVYSGSADEMFAKMRATNGADFDLVSFDTSLFDRYLDAGVLKPLDPALLPAFGGLIPEFQAAKPIRRGEVLYGVPFAWGSLPMIYDADAFPTPPDSWEVMWDAANSGRTLWQDDANNSITLGALITGAADPYNLTPEDMARIRDKLVAQKANLLSYYAGFDDGVNIFTQGGATLMYSMGEPQLPALKAKGINAALTIPKEGAVGWLDCWEMSAGVRDEALAHEWINACLAPSVGKVLTEKFGYGSTSNAEVNATAALTYGDQLSWLQAAEDYEARVALWNEIKAA